MGMSVAYNLAGPSADRCAFCGQGNSLCQCNKFDRPAQQDGKGITSPDYFGSISKFVYFANPSSVININNMPTLNDQIRDNGQKGDESLGNPIANAAQAQGLSSGPSGF